MENIVGTLNISEALVEAIGWTVLHSLWQGTIIALLVGVLAAFVQKQSAVIRYWTGIIGMLATLVWSGITFVKVYFSVKMGVEESFTLTYTEGIEQIVVVTENKWVWFANYFQDHLPLVVTIWILGVSVFALRFLGGLAYVRYLQTQYQPVREPGYLNKFEELKKQLGISRLVTFGISSRIHVPMTIGALKPVVLLPIGTLLALSPAQLEAVMAHELAHIKRRDYLVNVLQSFVEVIFYYHPAIWWLSAQIRKERENCCDDLAVAACGDDLAYAKALLSLQAYAKGAPAFAMAFSNKKDHLLNRVKRILNHPINRNRIMEKFSMATLVLICLLVISMRGNQVDHEQALQAEIVTTFVETGETRDILVEVKTDDILLKPKAQSLRAAVVDTLPQGKVNLKLTKDGEKIEAKLDKGKIQELKVNGQVQPKSAYDAYLPVLEEVMNTPPPAPPAPPSAVTVPAPPTPPTPPSAVSVPAPPTPPTAPVIIKTGQKRMEVKTEVDNEGNTFVFFSSDDQEEPMEVKIVQGGSVPSIVINGETIDVGEELIFISENDEIFEFKSEDMELHEAQIVRIREVEEKLKGQEAEMLIKTEKMAMEIAEQQAELEKQAMEMEKTMAKKMKETELHMQKAQKNVELYEAKVAARVKGEKATKVMLEEMVKDGLLESTDNYKIKLDDKSLKINGKKQSKKVHKKYKKIYDEATDAKGSYNITIQKSKY